MRCSSKVVKPAPNRAVISWRARAGDVADGFQPGAAQPRVMASSAPSADTGSGSTASASRHRHDAAMDMAGHRPRADRGAGDRGADGKTLRAQARHTSAHQRGFAAEQMGAAGDVEKQPCGESSATKRREAIAPFGDVIECLCVGNFIGIEHP
jgi:hypothetical protein